MTLRTWTAFVRSWAPAALLLVWVRLRAEAPSPGPADDADPELTDREVHALVYGGVAALAAWVAFTILEQRFGMRDLSRLGALPRDLSAVYSFGVVAAVEETLKLLAAALAAQAGRASPRRVTVRLLLCGAASGLGFSVYENYLFAAHTGAPPGARLVTLPVVHLCFGVLLGAGLAHAWPRPPLARLATLLVALAAAIGLHGAYDHVLFDPRLPRLAVAPLLALIAGAAWLAARSCIHKSPLRRGEFDT